MSELGAYAVYRMGGYSGLMWLFALLASLLFALVFVLCRRRCESSLAAFLGAVCAWFFSTGGLTLRPHLLGYTLLATELILLDRALRDRRWLWLLPPLFALWVNCHGSYFFGMAVLGAYWLSSLAEGKWAMVVASAEQHNERKMLGLALLLSGLALCLNPVGIQLLLYPLNVGFQQTTNLNAVQEWLPPDLREGRTLAMIAAALCIPLIASIRRLELPLRDILVTLAGFALALQHVRMMFVFGVVASPLISMVLAPLVGKDRKRDQPVANALFLCAFVVAIVWAFPAASDLERQVAKQNPSGAVDFIRRSKLSGPMLNEYVFGDYLIWALPEEKVFIDGSADVFDWTGVLQAYVDGRHFRRILEFCWTSTRSDFA